MKAAAVLILIDNYDSFTYNLVQAFGVLGAEVRVFRNDRVTVEALLAERPTHLVVSPGPCTPNEAGISLEAVRAFSGRVPVLGVCLGHQAIGQAFGGRVVRAPRLMHGKTSEIRHDGSALFAGVPERFEATRYHSLIVERASLPGDLVVTAETAEGDIMALRHRTLPTFGVQFHPESILTRVGPKILENFLECSA